MKRATALQVLAATLVVTMVVSAFPLAQVFLQSNSSSSPGSDASSSTDAANVGPAAPPGAAGSATDKTPGASDLQGSLGGPSSRPAGSQVVGSTGSTLLDQVLGTAKMMGIDAKLPDLPVDQLASVNPLRPAIMQWIAVTHSQVAQADLDAQLARADAMPQPLQRDLALLVLSASEATQLQNAALAKLTPDQLAWVRAHPELATQLARGESNADTRQLAGLAALVDTKTSVEASLLLLEAVEATRGSLQSDAGRQAVASLSSASLDAKTQQVLALLTTASTKMTDQQKILLAAKLIATTTGVAMPTTVAKPSFPDAVQSLLRATGQTPDAAAVQKTLDTVGLFPNDLQLAIGETLNAEANAVNAANPFTSGGGSDGQATALVGVLMATADALPTLEKYHLYWRDAPDALRIGQWDPAARAGWAVEHAALLEVTHADPTDLVRAVGMMHGANVGKVDIPERSFVDAYAALEAQKGYHPNQTVLDAVAQAGANLDPTVAKAAAHMLSGAAEAARLNKEAIASLTPAERQLMLSNVDTAALYAKPDITSDELATLQQLTLIQEKIDVQKLVQAEVTGVQATMDAKDIMSSYHAASDSARPYTFWSFVQSLLPWQTARAQSPGCTPIDPSTTTFSFGNRPGTPIVSNDCDHDILLVVTDDVNSILDDGYEGPVCVQFGIGNPCFHGGEIDHEALVITGLGTGVVPAEPSWRLAGFRCGPGAAPGGSQGTGSVCSANEHITSLDYEPVPAVGAATVLLDLGGSHTYARQVAVTTPLSDVDVSLQLDMGGADTYLDPTSVFDRHNPLYDPCDPATNQQNCLGGFAVSPGIGTSFGMPTEGAALAGGVAVLVHVQGPAIYQAPSLSQGYGQWGLGMVADLDPTAHSTYTARSYAQGASGREMNLGSGILVDVGGDDSYRANVGEGYGYGGVLLDTGGNDIYSTDAAPTGTPLVHLNVLPGGDLTALDHRDNNGVWIDGPASLNPGLGIDLDATSPAKGNPQDSDGDGFSDFEEFVAGTNPNDPRDCPDPLQCPNGALDREQLIAQDSDGDGFPDFVERALSTDPNDKASYPAGFPTGPTFIIPLVGSPVSAGSFAGSSPTGSKQDKIVDLRLPLQDAGSVDYACTGTTDVNDTSQAVGVTVTNIASGIGDTTFYHQSTSPAAQGPCVLAGYQTSSDGNGQVSVPLASVHGTNSPSDSSKTEFSNVTFHIPAGILAIGDSVPTSYDVDYFFVLDMGGDDTFHDHAGGALPVLLRNGTGTSPDPSNPVSVDQSTGSVGTGGSGANAFVNARNQTFLAPSLVLNVDLGAAGNATVGGVDSGARAENPNGTFGYDSYAPPANDAGDFSQGSMEGVLVDTSGDDTYVAGSGSQGALGGVLLDLAGDDSYHAWNLSQGAGLTTSYVPGSTPGTTSSSPADMLKNSNCNPCSPTAAVQDAGTRTSIPGLLLDLGQGTDRYQAGGNSQGVARGFPNQGSAAPATSFGILLDDGGSDSYDTATLHGTNSQGVGSLGGVGILADLAGDDIYKAWGQISQGAPISMTYGNPSTSGQAPGEGILLDDQGNDTYGYVDAAGLHDRSVARQDNLTITRSAIPSSGNTFYGDLGIHLDTDTNDPNVVVNSIMGTGTQNATSVQSDPTTATDLSQFYVDLPNAHLAIGSGQDTDYENEYAFVVDLGGHNTYHMNAGGFVPDIAGSSTQRDLANGTYSLLGSAYPVSFTLDAGSTGSNYTTDRTVAPGAGALAQGAGYFGIGVLVDLGGNDTFQVLPESTPSYASAWMPRTPTLDGTIGKLEWQDIASIDASMVGLNDTRYSEPLQLRVANDAKDIYVAISGHRTPTDSLGDVLTLDLLADPSVASGQTRGDAWDSARGVTLLDQSVLLLSSTGCQVDPKNGGDFHFGSPTDLVGATGPQKDVRDDTNYGCSMSPDGSFTVEIAKPLRAIYPADIGDLDVPYGAHGFDPSELRMRVQLYEHTTFETFIWPAGTTDQDGMNGYPKDGDLHNETSDWAAIGLASLGENGTAPLATRTPAFAQGAGIAGVGILAALGQTANDGASYQASDDAQGYGAYGGLGLLLDAGGSDTYKGDTFVQGASQVKGLGALVELDGDDDYSNHGSSLGYAPSTDSSAALFADLGGLDAYHTSVAGASDPNARNATVAPTSGASTDHRGQQSVTTIVGDVQYWGAPAQQPGNNGVGIDALSVDQRAAVDTISKSTSTDLAIHPVNTDDGSCDFDHTIGKSTIGTTQILTGSGLVCLDATASVQPPVADPTNGAALKFSVDGVSFLLQSGGDGVWQNVGGGLTTDGIHYVLTLNLSQFQDGVKTIFAQAVARGTPIVGTQGAIIVHAKPDAPTPPGTPGDTRNVLVDNEARVAVCTLPKLEIPAEHADDPCAANTTPAVFSTTAINGTTDLSILWAVSHDAQEESKAVTQGWQIPVGADPVHFANVPCPNETVGTCNVIPLWLTEDGSGCAASSSVPTSWGTQQPGYISGAQTQCPQYQEELPYTHNSGALADSLSIVKKDGFHLRLYNRTPFGITNTTPPQFTTRVIVKLLNAAENETVKDTNNSDIIIADQNFTAADIPVAGATSALPVGLNSVFTAVRDQINANPTVSGSLDGLAGLLAGLGKTNLGATVCGAPDSSVGGVCQAVMGHPSDFNRAPCDDGTISPTTTGCYQSGNDTSDLLNLTWSEGSPAYGANVRDTINNTAIDPTRVLNWTDMYVTLKNATDFNGSPLTESNGVLTIPAGYSFGIEIWTSNDNGIMSNVANQLFNLKAGQTVYNTACHGAGGSFPTDGACPRYHPGDGCDADMSATCASANQTIATSCSSAPTDACGPAGTGTGAACTSQASSQCSEANATYAGGACSSPASSECATYNGTLSGGACAGATSAGCKFVNGTIGDPNQPGKVGIDNGLYTTLYGEQLNGRTQAPLPVATFQLGDALNPSVFEIRTPAPASTTTKLAVSPLEPDGTLDASVGTLYGPQATQGDIAGGPTSKVSVCNSLTPQECHVDYSVGSGLRFTQHVQSFNGAFGNNALPDGLYAVNLTGQDPTHPQAWDTQPFLLDSTPPSTSVTTGNGFVGAALLAGGSAIPVTWDALESGSGVKQVGLWEHTGVDGLDDISRWHFISSFPDGIHEYADAGDRVSTIDDYYYVTVGEDLAGNVETQDAIAHDIACGDAFLHRSAGSTTDCGDIDWHIYDAAGNRTPSASGAPPMLYAGFLVKHAQGAWQKLVVDAQRPQSFGVPTVSGSGVSKASLTAGVNALYVRAGAPFEASVCGADADVGVNKVIFIFDYVDPATGNVTSWPDPTNLPADYHVDDAGACPTGGEKYVYDGWGGVNANKTLFPDGIWAVSADIYDRAGNRDQVSIATVILDGKAPTVALAAPIYPAGQEAVKPGDTLTLRVAPTDEFGVDTNGIRVDASALNATGVLSTHATRVNGVVYQEVSFKVDKVKRDDLYLIPVLVPDLAGNVWYGNFSVIVDTSRFDMVPGSFAATNVSYHSATVTWSTTTNTTSMVRYGTSPLELRSRTPVDSTLVKDHAVTIDGLDASTRYYFRVVSDTAGGYENESDAFDALTATALFLNATTPAAGARVSGEVPVVFSGGLHDSTDPVQFTLEARGSPTDPWSFVTTLTESGSDHELGFNSSRYLDGDGYELLLTAASGKDALNVTLGPFETDNSPPEIDVLSPLVATNQSTPTILAAASDNLAGFATDGAVTLTIDGQPADGVSFDVTDLTARITYPVASALPQGPHTFVLTVTDRAGNVATQSWTVAVDGVPPSVQLNSVKYAPGPTAAKLGGSVTVNLTAQDSSGVASIIADATSLSGSNATAFDHVAGTNYWVATFTVTSREDGATLHVPLVATDLAQNPRATTVDIKVDNVKPTVSSVRAVDVTQIDGRIAADADEPVTLVVTASAPDVPDVSAATTTPSEHPTLTLAGLFPSRTYSFHAKVLDGAGNEVDQDGAFQTALDLLPPTQVGDLTVLDLLNGTLRVSWPAAKDDVAVAYYRIYRSDDNGTMRPYATVNGTTFDDANLPLEKAYQYQVAAVDYGGNEGVASQALRASATAVPRLTVGAVGPAVGSTATVFRYVITYSSPGRVAPVYVRVLLDGAAQEMTSVGNGTYIYETRLAPNTRDHPHTYSFEASDGRYTVKFPADGSALRGPLVSVDPAAGSASATGVGFAQRVPMVGIVGTATAILAAAAAVLVLRRRGSK